MTNYHIQRAASFLLHTDVYKWGHFHMTEQVAPGTTEVFSNYTNRGSRIKGIDKVVHFGLAGFISELYFEFAQFLNADIDAMCDYYSNVYKQVMGTVPTTQHIRDLYEYGNSTGRFPVEFYSLPEGTEVPLRVPSFVFRNTDPKFSWLTNYLETWLSSTVWHPSTVATKALHFRRLLNKYALETTGSTEGVGFLGHDFSYRGLEGKEAAGASGAAHLLSFDGSDNLEAINYINFAYFDDPETEFILGSVLASEHSVMCTGSAVVGELETYKRLLKGNPSGIISLVSDTYDLWNVITNFLPQLKDIIEARDGKLVIRPDSGDPVDIICGNANALKDDPANAGAVELLWDIFGGTINEKGYKILNPKIGLIYGDSITPERAEAIFERLKEKGFASTNVVLALGSFAFQYNTRDTFGSAVKSTAVVVDGKDIPIYKDPATDNGTKKSAKGYIAVTEDASGELVMVDNLSRDEFEQTLEDGSNLLRPWSVMDKHYFKDVRQRVRDNM